MSDVDCLKFDAHTNADCDPCQNEQKVVVVQRILSSSPKASANATKKNSKLFKISDFISK